MDLLRSTEYSFRVQHRHDDGSWSELAPQPEPHDPADLDPEHEWSEGRLYKCTTCDEEVRVIEDREPEGVIGR